MYEDDDDDFDDSPPPKKASGPWFTIFITKRALDPKRGIYTRKAQQVDADTVRSESGVWYYKPFWHLNEREARLHAEFLRIEKIKKLKQRVLDQTAALEERISGLEKLEF